MPPEDPQANGGQPSPAESRHNNGHIPLTMKFDELSEASQLRLKAVMSRNYHNGPLHISDQVIGNADLTHYVDNQARTDVYYTAYKQNHWTIQQFVEQFADLKDDVEEIIIGDVKYYRLRLGLSAKRIGPQINDNLGERRTNNVVDGIVLASKFDDDIAVPMVKATNRTMYFPVVPEKMMRRRCILSGPFRSRKPIVVDKPALKEGRPDAVKQLVKDAIETGNIPFVIVYTEYMKNVGTEYNDDGKFGAGGNLKYIMKRLERSCSPEGTTTARILIVMERRGMELPQWLQTTGRVIGYLVEPVESLERGQSNSSGGTRTTVS